MQEKTKSRLTSFARFWPVSAIFFLTFCTGKYRPSINCDEESVDTTEIDLTFSINHESKEPNISDFVTAILKLLCRIKHHHKLHELYFDSLIRC